MTENNAYIKIDNVSKWYPVKSGFKSKKKGKQWS